MVCGKWKKLTGVTMAKVDRIKLGSQGLEVSAQGLGCMGMSAAYGPPKPESDMIALIHHAIDSGVTFLDTSDMYGPHTSEILLGKALRGGRKRKRGVGKMVTDIDDLPKNAVNYTALTPLWFVERAATVHPTRKSVVHGSRHYTWQ